MSSYGYGYEVNGITDPVKWQQYKDLFEGIELQKCLLGNSVTSVCLIFTQFSQ